MVLVYNRKKSTTIEEASKYLLVTYKKNSQITKRVKAVTPLEEIQTIVKFQIVLS